MRILAALLLSVALASPVAAAEDLDTLFAKLKTTADPHAAAPYAAEIWRIWDTAPGGDARVQVLMDSASDYIRHEEYQAALRALDAALALAPDYAEAWNRRALALYKAGDHVGSGIAIAQALAREPRHFGALTGLGNVNLALGRLPEALAAFEAALAVNPHLSYAKLQAAAIRAAMKRTGL